MEPLGVMHCRYKDWLWKNAVKESVGSAVLRTIFQVVSALIGDIRQGQLSLRAMSLVYTTIISLVPLFAISFSVLKGLGAHNQIRPFLLNTLDALGEKKFEIADKIIGFVNNIQVGVLGAVGIAVLLYTVIGMLQKIESSFNYVWNIPKSRSFSKRINDYLSVLFIAPLLIFLSTAMTASARSQYILDKLSNVYGVDMLIALIGFIIPYLILALAFTFLYSFVPNTKVRFKAAFISGLITALIWKTMGWGFSNFVANSANHAAVYSAFATIIVFMIWIYLVWLVLLIGASIGFYIQYPEYRKTSHTVVNISIEQQEALAIEVMSEVAKRFSEHESPVSTDELSELSGYPQNVIESVCMSLKTLEILTNEEDSHAWLPARPLEHISVYDVIHAVRSNASDNEVPYNKEAKAYLKKFDELLSSHFGKQPFVK